MGQALLLYHNRVQKEFITPLRAFLEVDVKNVMVSGREEEERKWREGEFGYSPCLIRVCPNEAQLWGGGGGGGCSSVYKYCSVIL